VVVFSRKGLWPIICQSESKCGGVEFGIFHFIFPWVADRRMASRYRIAVNILNKQLWTNDKEWSSSIGVGCGADNSST
jgi:hypothetical protein